MLKITASSHLDHDLAAQHLTWILKRFSDKSAFFIETVLLPDDLGALSCGLHGPLMGDAPVPDAEARLDVRGNRAGASRLCDRAPRLTRTLTVIAGPNGEDACILYPAFGGPVAPREPWDPSLDDAGRAASEAFWAEHALSR